MARERDFIGDKELEPGRFYAAYNETEEFHAGMWRTVGSETEALRLIGQSVALFRDGTRFQVAVDRVMAEWPVSCRVEFTRYGNQRAWLGQAACCLACGASESCSRRAWWKLTDAERTEANRIADGAIGAWHRKHAAPVRARRGNVLPLFAAIGWSP